MNENLRVVAAGVKAKVSVMLEVAKCNPEAFTLNQVTEQLAGIKALLNDALKLDAAERKLPAERSTESLIVDLPPGLDCAMSNSELRQAINDTTAHLRPPIMCIHLSDVARQILGNHLECLLQVEKVRAGIMFTGPAVDP